MTVMLRRGRWLVLSCCLLAGCTQSPGGASRSAFPDALPAAGRLNPFAPFARGRASEGSNRVQHVVILIQENQSFDHLFRGFPGANAATTGTIHTGATVPLTPQALGADTDTGHIFEDFVADYDAGKLDGFDMNTDGPKPNLLAYTYIRRSDIRPYFQLAKDYVLADNLFTSQLDGSFEGHQYLIAAQAGHGVNPPMGKWGCDGTENYLPTLDADRSIGPFELPCFTYTTLGDELDQAGLSWRFYAPYVTQQGNGGSWSAYQAISQIYFGPDWTQDVISPQTQILTDIPNGFLADVTWVVPDNQDSDHPGSHGKGGPSWIASVVNAIGESQFWDSTTIFLIWDDWGGEYDHVSPPYMDYDGDGFRVPMICISPYAYEGNVNHTQLESTSILKYVEDTFNLPTLTAADARADSAADGCINPSRHKPRAFTPIQADFSREHFLHEKPSGVPPDDS